MHPMGCSKFSKPSMEKKGKKLKLPKQRLFFICFPSATRKRKEGNKTRVMATVYITEERKCPAFYFFKGKTTARSLSEAITKFKARFPKSKGWTVGKVRRYPSGKSATMAVSFVRPRRKGD